MQGAASSLLEVDMEKKYVLCEGSLMHFRVSKLPWPFKAFFRGEDGKMTEHYYCSYECMMHGIRRESRR